MATHQLDKRAGGLHSFMDIVSERKIPMPMPEFEHWLLPVISLTDSLTCSYLILIKINLNPLTRGNTNLVDQIAFMFQHCTLLYLYNKQTNKRKQKKKWHQH
jgi:hypothetical protein